MNKRRIRKEMKLIKEQMKQIEYDMLNNMEDDSDATYLHELEAEYEALVGDYAEYEEMLKQKRSVKKHFMVIAAVITAIASVITLLWKFRDKLKRRK